MHFLFSLLGIKGLNMFRALLAHPQEALRKRHLVLYARSIPNAVCRAPPEDEQVMLETCRGPWFSINLMKSASRWFHCTDRYTLYWPIYIILTDIRYTDRYTLYWQIYIKLTDIRYTDRYTLYWQIYIKLTDIHYTDRYILYWPIYIILTGIHYTDRYTLYWPIYFILTGIHYTDRYTLYWPIYILIISRSFLLWMKNI
jgi:hypothetical protein